MKRILLVLTIILSFSCEAIAQKSQRNEDQSTAYTVEGQVGSIQSVDRFGNTLVTPATKDAASNSAILAGTSVDAATYTNIVVNTEKATMIDCYNGTDKTAIFSSDGTNVLFYIPTLLGKVLPLGDSGLHVDTTLRVKSLTDDATTGSILCTLFYGD
jgi:hypothetical protein